ncbi:ATPase [Bifidobacterium ramosum]|uniref:ATPase n=1 Tax=Bifidobacterium ramosum TaxID=1798158 RepID=A0A6L4X3K8_9BIFI|nr:ATP-binding protein [Bifidobacterium ramosum]KAB8289103.1 ATPase [Bifidobacterium ramosum]NEG70816.1 AAA family ATPase [Bifidobacterium ramosum]
MEFVGRDEELDTLDYHYSLDKFQMIVVYGRRRVGKTALLSRFCEDRPTLWFTAKEQSAAMNLRGFSTEVRRFFGETEDSGPFRTWEDAFSYVARKAEGDDRRFVFVFDEFPYAAAVEPSLPSVLQVAIDHRFKATQVMMVLCGSNEGFMESKVLGYHSPLYGRRNAQIQLKPFGLFDACRMMPGDADWKDRIQYYAVFGGTPYYLEQIDPAKTFQENVMAQCFSQSGLLYQEPMMLLRQELREPAAYSAVLDAIGSGRTRPKEIAEYAGIEQNAIGAYLRTLEQLKIVERQVPFGEDPAHSRKGLWKLRDLFFAYWYRFVAPATQMIDMQRGRAAGRVGTEGPAFDTYVGQQFETMCQQWLLRHYDDDQDEFVPTSMGKWWGNDPMRREQADIDIVMTDSFNHRVLLGECKWRESVNETETIDTLKSRSPLIKEPGDRIYYLFTKHPASETTRRKAELEDNLHLIDAEHMLP